MGPESLVGIEGKPARLDRALRPSSREPTPDTSGQQELSPMYCWPVATGKGNSATRD